MSKNKKRVFSKHDAKKYVKKETKFLSKEDKELQERYNRLRTLGKI